MSTSIQAQNFLSEQLKFERVQTAFNEKEKLIKSTLLDNHIDINQLNILLVAFKTEKKLCLYGKNETSPSGYILLKTYSICASSGVPGPKRKEGDSQVPEGFYSLNAFNPKSNFYLSLGINYPNEADRCHSNKKNPGGNIYIHGSCVTIGCLPITDDKIKEVYLYAVFARNSGQKQIPVYIFPFEMSAINMKTNLDMNPNNRHLSGFWENLKEGYDLFSQTHQSLNFRVNKSGEYVFKK